MKKEFSDLKKTKAKAVEYQKKYLKCCEKEIQFLYGSDKFNNFMFKKKKDESKFLGWSLIEGISVTNKQLR